MRSAFDHVLERRFHHFGWSRHHPPCLTIAPGDVVEVHVQDTSGGEITPQTSLADIGQIDRSRFTPLTGPIFIDGAEPGDAIKVTFLGFSASGWGWSLITQRYGILADQFPEPFLKIWSYDPSLKTPIDYAGKARIPPRPFPGIIGLARNTDETLPSLPPYPTGGNLDIKDLTEGTELYLPVEVHGGLLSLGDTHVAQGHGELAGTALESPIDVAVRVDLVKDARLAGPCFSMRGPLNPHMREGGYHATCGISSDLTDAARSATAQMIDLLGKLHGLSAIDAYLLCSLCGDLIINEMVNKPMHVVSLYFPRTVLE
ncbi:acetamidase/formamidase family protein [Rhodoligotrophos ferricapiens]|uniref:acetamidase/formamidase family protein n=1 Tax=Rhodoligotrophos ferricapiens TaxID=3069264 RepID=UPI00315DC6F5